MKIEQLKVVLEVLTAGSISAAAKKLDISQPSVSRIVKGVEKELGVTLFDRFADGIHLTENGEKLLPHIEQVVQSFSALTREARNFSVELCSEALNEAVELNVTISPIVLDSIMGPALEKLDQELTGARLKIHLLDCINPNELDKLPLFDLYIGHNIENSLSNILKKMERKSGYTVELLYAENFCLIMDKEHPLAVLESISKMDAIDYPQILHDNGFSSNDFYKHYYPTEKEMTVLFKSNNPRTISNALHQTQAVFFTTEFLARRDYLQDECLAILPVRDLKMEYFCMYPKKCVSRCIITEILLTVKKL